MKSREAAGVLAVQLIEKSRGLSEGINGYRRHSLLRRVLRQQNSINGSFFSGAYANTQIFSICHELYEEWIQPAQNQMLCMRSFPLRPDGANFGVRT